MSDTAPAPVAAVARGGAINLVGAVVYGASNFVVLVVLNHSLGVEQAAVVVVAIALFNVVSTVAALGCTTGLVRTISRLRAIDEPERLHATLRVALGPVLVVSCAAALAVAAAAPALAEILADGSTVAEVARVLRWMAPFIPLATLHTVVIQGTRGFDTMVPVVAVERIGRAVALPAVIVVATAAGTGPTGAAAAWAATNAVALVFSLRAMTSRMDRALSVSGRDPVAADSTFRRAYWRFTAPRAVGQAAEVAVNWSDTIIVSALVSTMANNSPDAMSYLEMLRWHQCGGGYFPTFMDSVARFSLDKGTIELVNRMIEDGKPEVRLSTPVKAVLDEGDKVVVQTLRGESIRAAAVICCLPMNTIFNIDFQPPLPAGVVEAGKARHTGVGFKLYVKLKGDVGNMLSVATSGPLDYVMTYKQAGDYTLMVGFGQDPAALDVYDDEAVQAAVRTLVPGAELIATMSYDWNSDPYARGTFASYRPGWVGKYYDVFQKDQGRVFFGSSDHGEGWRGFIDGAIGGGIKAAERVSALLA